MSTRQPLVTRNQILEGAFRAVYERGLAATSVDDVLARTGVTKGALYHHFDGKQALGCAFIDEVLAPRVHAAWIAPLAGTVDPISALQQLLRGIAASPPVELLQFGCPLNNLAQEVAAIDEQLRRRVNEVFQSWIGALREALRRGQAAGTVRRDGDVERAAVFIVAAIEGAVSVGKATRDRASLSRALDELATHLESLRPRRRGRRRPRRARARQGRTP